MYTSLPETRATTQCWVGHSFSNFSNTQTNLIKVKTWFTHNNVKRLGPKTFENTIILLYENEIHFKLF